METKIIMETILGKKTIMETNNEKRNLKEVKFKYLKTEIDLCLKKLKIKIHYNGDVQTRLLYKEEQMIYLFLQCKLKKIETPNFFPLSNKHHLDDFSHTEHKDVLFCKNGKFTFRY